MSFAILRMQKVKGNMSGIGKHLDRSSDGEISVPENVQENQIQNNIHWNKHGKAFTQKEWTEYTKENTFSKRINTEIKERYTIDKKIRKDAVRCIEYIMTSDHQKMTDIFSDQNIAQEWIKDNKEFLENIYGKENIVSMHLHLDEHTPHLHATVTPITNDGRLSAKDYIDGKKILREQQTTYAKIMEKYGMERGEKGSTAKHTRPREYRKQQINRTR